MKNKPPDIIYLQWGGIDGETTWCRDEINNDDIKYTRHNSHNDMVTFIADYLQIDRHELGNLIQEMQHKAMIERGEITTENKSNITQFVEGYVKKTND